MITQNKFDHVGTIVSFSGGNETGVTTVNEYTGVRSQKKVPLGVASYGEERASNQSVAFERNTWVIRRENRIVLARKMAYMVNGKTHHITGVRDWQGSRDLIALDTEYRDN